MSEKKINTRVINKHDTASNWSKATNFIPKQGEIIIYDVDNNNDYEHFKIGDGVTNVNELPLLGAVQCVNADGAMTEEEALALSLGVYYFANSVNLTSADDKTMTLYGIVIKGNDYLDYYECGGVKFYPDFGLFESVDGFGLIELQGSGTAGQVLTRTDAGYLWAWKDVPTVTVDDMLSSTSTNPVQNKVVNTAISNLNTLVGDTSVSSQISAAVTPKLDAIDAAWVQVYDSGEITSEVNSISSINVTGYKSLMIAVKCVNTTNTTSTRSGAVIFTGSNSQDYAFNNIFSNLLKNGTSTSGAIAKFKIVDGFIICENALRAITADGMLSDTEGEGIDTLAPVSGGLIKCTSTVTTMAVSSAAQSAEHFYGVGSRVIVWGCKV